VQVSACAILAETCKTEIKMADWNPSLYLQYGAERTRPAAELLARIPLDDVLHR
jgi:hypothetical protein